MDSSSKISTVSSPGSSRRLAARTLDAIVAQAPVQGAAYRGDVAWGDEVVVTTRNSVYTIIALPDGSFAVRGGWFDRQSEVPTVVPINGCTWGGCAIQHDILAAPGLFLEFGNGVVTTRIQRVAHLRRSHEQTIH